MPRLDFHEAVEIGLASEEEVIVERRDPGMFGPFDLCLPCYHEWSCATEVAHPPYEQWLVRPYPCKHCGADLTEEDN